MLFPIHYNEPLFRPPSEARSFILQLTLGCSWNRCSFCEMYQTKKFRVRKTEDIFGEIKKVAMTYPQLRKVFLADGDALVLSTSKLLKILQTLRDHLPQLQRVSSYALASNLARKTVEELKQLRGAGLKLIYLGIESGDDEVLRRIQKGETKASTIKALNKVSEANIDSSVMILNGLGGSRFSEQHAIHSAEVLNTTQPKFVSTLVLSFPAGEERFRKSFGENFLPLNQSQLLKELQILLEHTHLKKSIFRSDHASNYLPLKGNLNRDKEKLLRQIQKAIEHPESSELRKEWQRGL